MALKCANALQFAPLVRLAIRAVADCLATGRGGYRGQRGVLEAFIGGTNVDDRHPEEEFAADTYYRKCEGRGCPAWTKDQYFGPPAKLAAMLLASDRPVAPFLYDVCTCAVPCCVAQKDNVSFHRDRQKAGRYVQGQAAGARRVLTNAALRRRRRAGAEVVEEQAGRGEEEHQLAQEEEVRGLGDQRDGRGAGPCDTGTGPGNDADG